MNTTENSIMLRLRKIAKKISVEHDILMSTAMLSINIAMADSKLQKTIEKSAVMQFKRL